MTLAIMYCIIFLIYYIMCLHTIYVGLTVSTYFTHGVARATQAISFSASRTSICLPWSPIEVIDFNIVWLNVPGWYAWAGWKIFRVSLCFLTISLSCKHSRMLITINFGTFCFFMASKTNFVASDAIEPPPRHNKSVVRF